MKAKALACLSLNDGNLSITICTSGLVDGSFQKKLVELGLLIRECLALFSDFDNLGAWLGPAEESLSSGSGSKMKAQVYRTSNLSREKTRLDVKEAEEATEVWNFFPFPSDELH